MVNNPIIGSTPAPQTRIKGSAWYIRLLGTLTVYSPENGQQITHFQTRMTGSLLAFLAYHNRPMPRDIVIEAIWPGVLPKSGRNRLSLALSSLRTLLASTDVPATAVFLGDAHNISLNPALFTTDVAAFERAVKRAKREIGRDERRAAFDEAITLYTDDLMLGRYESWVEAAQDRLRQMYQVAVDEQRRLTMATSILPLTSAQNRGATAPVLPTIPYALTRFFGREGEITHLVSVLTNAASDAFCVQETRDAAKLSSGENLFFDAPPAPLITLTGMGGMGKSRLATETARRVSGAYRGRAWFVELAQATDARQIWVLLRDTLGLAKESEENAPNQVIAFLSSKASLLILDNMEQFVETGDAVDFINVLRSKLPGLSLLVTSRHIVGAYGEQILQVGSLLAPADWTGVTPSAQDTVVCIDLFADRARAVRPSFVVSKANLGVVARLCQALEGIPLAIELAAARLDFLTPSQLLAQVEQRFALLKSRRKDIPARHRSLYAAIETSYRFLPPDLQRTFHSLSVFRGGWTFDAAAAVCGLDEIDLWDTLTELSERSLIQGVGEDGGVRFRMLDTLREFAAERLQAAVGEEAMVQKRHRDFFTHFAADAESHLAQGQTKQADWLDALEADHDNLRAVLEDPSSAEAALQMARQIHRFWLLRGYAVEGKNRIARLLEAAPAVPHFEKAKANNALGVLAWASGALKDAQERFTLALDLYQDEGDIPTIAGVLNNIGIVASQNGIFYTARDSYNRSLNLYRILNDPLRQSIVLTNLGTVLMYQAEFEAAMDVLEEVLGIQRDLGDSFLVRATLQNIAEVAVGQRNIERAVSAIQESLSLRREVGERSTFWNSLETVVSVLYLGKRFKDALVLCSAASAARAQSEAVILPVDLKHETEMMQNLRMMLPIEDIAIAERTGNDMDFMQALDFAQAALSEINSSI